MSARVDRRQVLRTGALAAAGLALGKAPAFAQKRTLTMLSFNSFFPASDEELRRQAEAFGKQAGVEVRVDTISSLQLPQLRRRPVTTSLEPPKTWAELLKQGKVLKAQGNPVGIAISHSNDANTTSASVLWSYGGKVFASTRSSPCCRRRPTSGMPGARRPSRAR